ncbi:MAG: ATP-binding cassette domain-containing protein [Phycisphaerae bacterium]
MTPLLDVRGLALHADTVAGRLPLVCDVDLSLARGKALALVGESGSGKSLTALAIARLLPPGVARSAGTVCLAGEPIESLDERQFQRRARSRIAFVFQDSASALDPLMPVGEQIAETLRVRGERAARPTRPPSRAPGAGRNSRPRAVALAPIRTNSGGMKQPRADRRRAGQPGRAADRRRTDHRAGRHRAAQIFALLAELRRDAGVRCC